MHDIYSLSTFPLSSSVLSSFPFLSSHLFLFSFSSHLLPPLPPPPCKCPSTNQRVLDLFLQQRSCWSQDLWLCSGPHLLSQLRCLVPTVIEVQGSLMCCQSLIRQGQSNPDEREVAGNIIHSVIHCTFYNLTAHFNVSIIPLPKCGRVLTTGQIMSE